MRIARTLIAGLLLVGPGLALLSLAGCGDKTETVRQTEERHESEPQMVSPGEPIVE
jgi:hypothetical protein